MRYIYSLVFLMIASLVYSQIQIEIEGGIRVGEVSSPVPPGTMRFNSTTCVFEGWNGLFWVPLSSFYEFGTITDVDNNTYKTVKINGQEWMAQNLRTSRYFDNSFIDKVIDSASWVNTTDGAWIWYNNDFNYETPYGKLYNWHAVNSGKLCPENWHVPSENEWMAMRDSLLMFTPPGGALKERDTDHWNSPNTGANNQTGFTGIPGGLRPGGYQSLGEHGYFWSSTASSATEAVAFYLYAVSADLFSSNQEKFVGASVRCVRSQ